MINNSLTLNHLFVLRNNLVLKKRFDLRRFCLWASLLTVILLIFYIFQINIESSEKYLIQKYENKLNQLIKENNSLMANSFQVNSLDNIAALLEKTTQSQELRFEKVGRIHYIRILDTQLVSR